LKRGRKKGTPRTGGRLKGTPNKATDETRALIEATLGASPLERMARLAKELLDGERVLLIPVQAQDRETGERRAFAEPSDAKAIEVATKLLTELAQYCAPKRKAIEVSGPDGAAVPIGKLTIEVVPSNAA